ncbi:hypothetical protein D3C72_2447670 [compost metagenome]
MKKQIVVLLTEVLLEDTGIRLSKNMENGELGNIIKVISETLPQMQKVTDLSH